MLATNGIAEALALSADEERGVRNHVGTENNVTSRDVAKLAGVSQATVSYVLSGNERQKISEETRERVIRAAGELGYVPNRQAGSLRSRRSGCVSVMMDKFLQHPRYAGVTEGLRQVLEEQGIGSCCVVSGRRTDIRSTWRPFWKKRADRIVYIGADGKVPPADVLAQIKERKIPFVTYDCEIADEEIAAVTLDYPAAVRQVVRRLKERDAQTSVIWGRILPFPRSSRGGKS